MTSDQLTADRLEGVIAALEPLLPRRKSHPAARQLSVEGLRRTLANLAPHILEASQRGDQIDVWSVTGIGRDEVRNARVLTWLLDTNASHRAGDAYLMALWREIRGRSKLGFDLVAPRSALREHYPLGSTDNRVDIEVSGANFLLFIEVKIDAPEGANNQLTRYEQLARAKSIVVERANGIGATANNWAVLYLCREPKRQSTPSFLQFGWRDVSRAIRRAVRELARSDQASHLAMAFAAHADRLCRAKR